MKKHLLAGLLILTASLGCVSAQAATPAPSLTAMSNYAARAVDAPTAQQQRDAAFAASAVQSAQQSPVGLSHFAMIAPPHQVAQRYVGGGELTGDLAAISLFGTLLVLGAWLGRCHGKRTKE